MSNLASWLLIKWLESKDKVVLDTFLQSHLGLDWLLQGLNSKRHDSGIRRNIGKDSL
jgi:hypothetical protein